MTHRKLVELGRVYLMSAKFCNPVFCEKGKPDKGNLGEEKDLK